MSYIITFLTALILGFIGGFLVFRKHAEKIAKTEDSGKKLLDALKGR
jgi:uncharacterized protein YneF (UPF0154 family)